MMIGNERIVGGRNVDETETSIVVCERIVVGFGDCHLGIEDFQLCLKKTKVVVFLKEKKCGFV
jgi:hypothetical protein